MKIIDISHWNTITDWGKVAKSCDGVIIKVGGSDYNKIYIDNAFLTNYEQAKKHGLKVGVYWFTGRVTSSSALSDSKYLYKFMCDNNIKCDLPVFLDIEMQKHINLQAKTVQDIIKVFCKYLENKKLFAGIYTFLSFYNTKCGNLGKRFYLWIAHWNGRPDYYKNDKIVQAHQYTSKGRVNGISGDVDISTFNDIDKVIKKAGLNK